MLTLEDFHYQYLQALTPVYDVPEAESIFWIVLEHHTGYNKAQFSQYRHSTVSESVSTNLHSDLIKLQNASPVQYVLGEAYFYGRYFDVNSSVLIPRGETEELVHLILEQNDISHKRTLDIGTGSGAIAITLAAQRSAWEVTAVDISAAAIAIGEQNAGKFSAKVEFVQMDILQSISSDFTSRYDIIVSNPPYVTISEKAQMHANVLDNEPSLALFVSDDDPLLFYRRIGELALDLLQPDGRLYFEINQYFGQQTIELLRKMGYRQVELYSDLSGRDRMVSALRVVAD